MNITRKQTTKPGAAEAPLEWTNAAAALQRAEQEPEESPHASRQRALAKIPLTAVRFNPK